MQYIDLTKGTVKVCNQYIDVPQPMYVYHSEKELDENASGGGRPPLLKIRSVEQYMFMLRDLGLLEEGSGYVSVLGHNIWIKTFDEFLPETVDFQGNTTYKKDENGNQIPIESGWVRLYKIFVSVQRHMLYTSSGIWLATLTYWHVGCGIKPQFVAISRQGGTKEERYQSTLKKILGRKTVGVKEAQAVSAMLNPMSSLFLDIDKAIGKVFGAQIKKADRHKLITSQAFRSALMKEISVLFPDLTKAIRDEIPPEDMAKFFKEIVKKSIKDEGSSEAMERMKDVVEMAYSTKTFEGYPGSVPILGEHQPAPQLEQPKTDEELDEERNNQSYPDSYVMDDLPEDFENAIPTQGDN